MKKIILGACLALAMHATKAQTQLIKEYNLNFISQYAEEADGQHFEKQGSFYILSGPKNFGTTPAVLDPVLVKLNSDGTLAGLNKRYTIGGNQYATHITSIASTTSSADVGYLLSGVTALGSADASNFLIKTDISGNIVWKKNFTLTHEQGNNIAMRITQVIQASNMKVYIVGMLRRAANYTTGDAELVIIKLNPVTGHIEWHKEYQSEYLSDFRTTGIIEGQPGKFKVFGASANSGAPSFIFSFQESIFGTLTSPNLKLVDFSGTAVNQDITAMHYYQNGYVIGGNVNAGTQNSVFLFRMDNNLNNPISLSGTSNQTNCYLNTHFPELAHITNNSAGLILSGSTSAVTPYSSFVMLVGTNGSVINRRKGYVSKEHATTSVDCFTDGTGFATLHNRTDGNKNSRFTKYSSIGFTCEDTTLANSSSNNYNVSVQTVSTMEMARPLQTVVPTVTASNFQVSVFNICETCATTPTAGPITTSSGGTIYCSGTMVLTAPSGFSSYQWTHNGNAAGTGQNLNITTGGSYSVYMLDAAGCEAVQTISITNYGGCVINTAPPNVTYCSLSPGSIPTIGWSSNPLSGCTGKWSFDWYYEGTEISGGSYNHPFVGPGTYSVVALTPCGNQTFAITVTDQLIEYGGHAAALSSNTTPYVTFVPVTPPPVGYAYSWTVTNTSTSLQHFGTASSIYINPYNPGEVLNVTLKLFDVPNCKTYSNTITFIDNPGRTFSPQKLEVKNEAAEEINMSVSPNPASNQITVAVKEFNSDLNYIVNIYSVDGSKLNSIPLVKNKQVIDINSFANGVYIVEISEGKRSVKTRLIIAR